jgi:hypothetical protein
MKQLSVAVSGLLFLSTAALGQNTTSANHNASLQLSNAIELSFLDGASGASLAFSTASHYNDGVIAASAATLRVRSNKAYNVTVKTATANFTSTSTTVMPVSGVLHVKENSQATFKSLSNIDQNLLINQNRGINSFKVTYRATPGFNYDGGSYSVNVIYTATQL